jgi:hypothetical protein
VREVPQLAEGPAVNQRGRCGDVVLRWRGSPSPDRGTDPVTAAQPPEHPMTSRSGWGWFRPSFPGASGLGYYLTGVS